MRPSVPSAAALSLAFAGLVLGAFSQGAPNDDRFDGVWDTVLSCPNSNGALGYSFEFDAIVKHGVLHAEKGIKDKPGWLQLNGNISPDGAAKIYASGLVGAAETAVGHRPAGTQYGYHIEGTFSDSSGSGHRVEGRPCTVMFTKKS
jgi:hypothetical protein